MLLGVCGETIWGSVHNTWVGLGPERWGCESPPGTLGGSWACPWAGCHSVPWPSARSLQTLTEPKGRRLPVVEGRRGPDGLFRSLQIRSDTSQILEENIPLLKAKVTEMRGIYTKVDQLEVRPGACAFCVRSCGLVLALSSSLPRS